MKNIVHPVHVTGIVGRHYQQSEGGSIVLLLNSPSAILEFFDKFQSSWGSLDLKTGDWRTSITSKKPHPPQFHETYPWTISVLRLQPLTPLSINNKTDRQHQAFPHSSRKSENRFLIGPTCFVSFCNTFGTKWKILLINNAFIEKKWKKLQVSGKPKCQNEVETPVLDQQHLTFFLQIFFLASIFIFIFWLQWKKLGNEAGSVSIPIFCYWSSDIPKWK